MEMVVMSKLKEIAKDKNRLRQIAGARAPNSVTS